MKMRAAVFAFLIILFIILICLSSYALTRPNAIRKAFDATSTSVALYSQISTATQEAQQKIDQTATVFSAISTQTQSAALIANTQTQAAIPSTFTPLPTQSSCRATLNGRQILYKTPSDALLGEKIIDGSELEVIGKLDDSNWYQTRYNNQIGWLQGNVIQGLDPNCPTLIGISNSLGLQGTTVIDDTFYEAKGWFDVVDSQNRLERNRGQYNDFQLQVDGYFTEKAISTEALKNVSSFDLVTSFYRQNGGDQSYVGIRFGNANSSFAVYIYGDCSIEVKSSTGYDEKQPAPVVPNLCRDTSSDYLRAQWNGNELVIWVNDTNLVNRFQLGTSYPQNGQVELLVSGAKAQFLFFALTIP